MDEGVKIEIVRIFSLCQLMINGEFARQTGEAYDSINSPVTVQRPTGGYSCQSWGEEHRIIPYVGDTSGTFGDKVYFVLVIVRILRRDVTVHDSGRIRNGTSIEQRMTAITEMFDLVTVQARVGLTKR